MTWLENARAHITEHCALPSEATLKQRRARLREISWAFHQGTSWGKKVWSKATREYLQRHGLPPRQPQPVENAPNFGADIIFPYRQTGGEA